MVSSSPLDELYLQWLYGLVNEIDESDPSRTRWNIFKKLYTTEFVWIVPNDDNRVADGKDLRYEFARDARIRRLDRHWRELGCSFLEMLVALSRRLAFEAEGAPDAWFRHLMHTLDLWRYTDDIQLPEEDVEEILNRVIWRRYHSDGEGGLFPLKHPHQDQTQVEIWYQLNSYLMENG